MRGKEIIRIRNPFHDPLVTELIEEPERYSEMFSERILVGETLEVFQPVNVVLVGPQGSGKSMILNLIRYIVLSEWISKHGKPPTPLKHISPFFGISVNLVRANFHVFGRRSVSRMMGRGDADQAVDAACAADFLSHYLFREFLNGIKFILSDKGPRLRDWLGIDRKSLESETFVNTMASWNAWFGYYSSCNSLDALLSKCEERLYIWRSFLNVNRDDIPKDVWESKSMLEESLHAMGNLLCSISPTSRRIPLFVVIDQYEVLPELNPSYGLMLQRVVNTLIKARDPVVFYKIGARTHDWGKELRVWGAESRIEVQRDYVMINLADILMRKEDAKGWLFPDLARDVANKRVKIEGHYKFPKRCMEEIFGKWNAAREAWLYFDKSRKSVVLRKVSSTLKHKIESLCGPDSSPLDLRLAEAWVIERLQRHITEQELLKELQECPWRKLWWQKERKEVALLQIASLARQKRLYFGWKSIIYLSGANISAFLLLCSEIWDMATKMDVHPLREIPLPPQVQTEGVYLASEKWCNRDRNEQIGGRKRYEVLSRLGPAIHNTLISDLAISNPGHSGFSLRETDLLGSERGEEVAKFLQKGVNWAVFEERPHTSKKPREATMRRKWYLHPLLSPTFAIPHKRVKEPLYVTVDEVYNWIYGKEEVKFGRVRQPIDKHIEHPSPQLRIPFEGL